MLKGRSAVVTGAAQGIGFAIAKAFVAQGASVVLADLDGELAVAAAETLGGLTVARGVQCDVRDLSEIESAIDCAEAAFGPIEIFVNNAGFTRDRTMRRMTEDDFDEIIAVHLRGTWNGTRASANRMRELGRGTIVNMSSMSGKVGNLGQTNYSAAKAGIVGLTKAAAKEVAFKNVRVNVIQPGYIDTPMTAAMPESAKAQKLAEIPMGRVGAASEVADVAVFLASDLSSYMTGAVLEVAGGRFM